MVVHSSSLIELHEVTATQTTGEPALFERFRLTYPSGTVVTAFYAGGALLEEVQVTHPMAEVEPVEAPS